MELQLGLALPTLTTASFISDSHAKPHTHFTSNKRTYSQLCDHMHPHATNNTTQVEVDVILPTLSLLPLTPDPDESHPANSSTITKNDGDDVVGWPPVNSWRKKLRYDYDVDNYGDEVAAGNNDQNQLLAIPHHQSVSVGRPTGSNTMSLYVKVKMEGVGIARKVDLTMHHSFHTLKQTLMDMFGKCPQHSNSYELTYQDQEGDWLLADDVPWRSFIQCAQRLKLVKNRG